MVIKNLTQSDAKIFWHYLEQDFPEICSQLKNYSFLDQSIVSFQPRRMSDEDYAAYKKIKDDWLKDNGFL